MNFSTEDIYQSILLRAADEWGLEFGEQEQDFGRQLDPLVRYMAGGLASELAGVYKALAATEDRLQRRLAEVLLPEYYHLPKPAHALATVQPEAEQVIDERFLLAQIPDEEDQAKPIYEFSPVFESRLLPLRVEVLATDTALVSNRQHLRARRRDEKWEPEETKRILLGFSSPVPLLDWRGACLYFDLKGQGDDSGEKSRLLRGLNGCLVGYGNQQLGFTRGLGNIEGILEDYLNGNEQLRQRVKAYYERHFITFRDNIIGEPPSPYDTRDFLHEWFSASLDEESIATQIRQLDPEQKQPLYFLEIILGTSVEILGLSSRLQVMTNIFPVVNRSLNGNGKGEHHYLRSSSLKWLHLQPKKDFLAIRRVYLEQPPEYPVFTYKPFSDFKADTKPAYTLRHGGIGRWDEFNTWKRLAYVITILQEEYAHQDLIQEVASSLSLEEVHQLLGQRLAGSDNSVAPSRDIYVLLHTGLRKRASVRVEYWTSEGEAANELSAGTPLRCLTKGVRLEKGSGRLLTTTRGGRSPLAPIQQLDAIKKTVLSRGRIVTREDVKAYCRDFLRDKLETVSVQDGVGVDSRFDFGMIRTLDVSLLPAATAGNVDWDGLCHQLSGLLEANSSGNIPFRVSLQNMNGL